MSLLTEAVAQEQQRIKRMISQYETELSCLPKGVLITKSIKGNQYFYLQYRNGKYNGEPYDIVFGPVANDTIYRTFIAYEEGILTKDETIARLKVKKLFDQMTFTTELALKELKYIGQFDAGRDQNE